MVEPIFLYTINAQEEVLSDTTVDELFNLSLDEFLDIVITPSKLPQPENYATQKIDVISAREIETSVSGNRNLCEIIGNLPGSSVTVLSRNDVNWGTYGGIGPKYSTFMLQGIPVDAFVDPMSLDNNIIKQIEVQRGPASVIYPNYLSQDYAGTQSPLAGTVNLILKSKIDKRKTMFKTAYGSYNTLNEQIYHENRINNLNYFFGLYHETSEYTNYGTEGSWLQMNESPEYKKTKIYGGLTYFLDKDEKQKIMLFYQKTKHIGSAGRLYRGFDHEYGTFNAGYDLQLNNNLHLQSHIGIRSYDRSWQESQFGVIDTLRSTEGVNQFIIPVDLSLTWSHGKNNLLILGGDYQTALYETWSDPLLGYKLYSNKSTTSQNGIYIKEDWRPVKGLSFSAGMRLNSIITHVSMVNSGFSYDNSSSWKKILWSTGARYNINDWVSVFANSGTSFAPPSLKSSSGTISMAYLGIPGYNGQLPNPNLKPEKGFSADAGADFMLPTNIRISTRLFYTVLNDAIIDNIVSRNPSQTQSINTESSSTGCEIELTHRVNKTFSWYINGTYIDSNVENHLNPDQNDVQIPFSPNSIANLGINYYSKSGFTATSAFNYNGGFYDGITKTDYTWFTPGFVLNVYLSQVFSRKDSYTAEVFAQLYNLTNNDYEMPWQFKNPGFSGMYGIRLTIN